MTEPIEIENMRSPQRQRLTYIESVAYWEGVVDRPRIASIFSVTENHVTKDFRLYKKAYPGNIHYDEVARAYRPSKRFKPRIASGDAEEYLTMLRTQAEREVMDSVKEFRTPISTYALPAPFGTIDKDILNAITRSISSGLGIEISYQSMEKPAPTTRIVWPHALIFNGIRWHARAYDETRKIYIDLVLQRILTAKSTEIKLPDYALEDEKWTQLVEIEVVPKLSLKPNQASVVAREFGMIKDGARWVWKAKMRSCVAGYFIVHNRLDVKNDKRRLIALKDEGLIDLYLPPVQENT